VMSGKRAFLDLLKQEGVSHVRQSRHDRIALMDASRRARVALRAGLQRPR